MAIEQKPGQQFQNKPAPAMQDKKKFEDKGKKEAKTSDEGEEEELDRDEDSEESSCGSCGSDTEH